MHNESEVLLAILVCAILHSFTVALVMNIYNDHTALCMPHNTSKHWCEAMVCVEVFLLHI